MSINKECPRNLCGAVSMVKRLIIIFIFLILNFKVCFAFDLLNISEKSLSYRNSTDDMIITNYSISSMDTIQKHKEMKKKSSIAALSLALSPLILATGLTTLNALAIEKRDVFDMKYWQMSYILLFQPSITLFTIPGHIYVHNSILKVYCIEFIKVVFLIAEFSSFSITPVICDSDQCDENNSSAALFIGSSLLFGAAYIYEVVDITVSAKKYNDKMLNKNTNLFYIQPLAWKGEYRLNVGYSF
ncbi:MAG: hypothetical protein NT056_08165 [Proteobacteria bacterium]|nr:hypothetical protein [Pseudomonadota bacterium]